MTATRMGRRTIVLGVLVAAGGALWVWAASLLWRTSVPDDLGLPNLAPGDYLSARDLDRASDFETFLRIEWLVATVVELAVLAALVFFAPRLARAFDLGRVGRGVMVGLVVSLALWLVAIPFGLVELWWQRRYDLVKTDYGTWLAETWFALGGGALGITIDVAILMLIAGWLGRRWWLGAAPAFFALVALVFFVYPFAAKIGTKPVEDRALASDVRQLAREQGAEEADVRVEEVSDETRAVNAMALGFGSSSLVILWDTLLDGRLSDGAVRVVTAHEFGHVAHQHILKGLAWTGLLLVPLLFLAAQVTERRRGLASPETVPLLLLVLTVVGLAISPFANAIGRRYEAEADWAALQATRDPRSAFQLFEAFVRRDLSQPDPPTWAYLMLDDHPTIDQRIEMVAAWQSRNQVSSRRRLPFQAGS